ncbi:glycine oxidase [Nocardioides luteus]|uniref:glycine oxidase n=1 Tax=Nocardioides luteus TaxID=1844 RepID=A0ABQ5SUH2_9ACTN|nr:glycine oxidase ThiO [Nocardioides luteus]MDR7309400.1 glycine oxidase [Nocardioides luteus]GGR51030.1 putative thiamine biosynthesis oxidoreductase ThiO [Nocardioides luteus]GLJ67807.1 putative thiamine biosynthesis oxidoreductase ThiO [Nocardioides luteus]
MRVQILGAGIVGLSVADELIRRGHEVTLVDPSPGSGASYAAAGMLSPAGEAWHGEEELTRLGLSSLGLWPSFAARLGVPMHTRGTLLAGVDAGDVQQVERQLAVLDLAGVRYERLLRRELLAREPGLGRVAGGAFLPEDHSVDPRAVVAALLDRLSPLVEPGERQRAGVETNTVADVTVVATGARLPAPYSSLIRPVRGDVVRVRTPERIERTVRAWVHGEQVYVVPRADTDEVVIGATSEERDGPLLPTVEGVWRLLDSARRVLPGLDRAAVVEVTSRDRPGTADNLPLVGPTDEPGVVLAAGAFRNGVLLAPLIARLVADHVETGVVEAAVDPRRFSRDTRSTGDSWT